jgi:hypothetical protein
MTTIDEAIKNTLYDETPRTFKDIELSPHLIRYPRSTVWDHLLRFQRKGKVACVRSLDGKRVTWYWVH